MKSFAEQHPILLGVGIMFGAATLLAFWQLTLLLLILAIVGYGLYRFTLRYDRLYQLQRHRRADLVWHADVEHQLLLAGDPRGIFGQYPPRVRALRDIRDVGCNNVGI